MLTDKYALKVACFTHIVFWSLIFFIANEFEFEACIRMFYPSSPYVIIGDTKS